MVLLKFISGKNITTAPKKNIPFSKFGEGTTPNIFFFFFGGGAFEMFNFSVAIVCALGSKFWVLNLCNLYLEP